MGWGQSPTAGRLAHNQPQIRRPPSSPPRRGACLGLDGGRLHLHPARRRRISAPRHPPCGWGSKATAAATLAGGGQDCAPPQGLLGSSAAVQPEGRLGTGRIADRCEPRGGATPGRRVRSQSRAAQPAPQAWLCWRGWAERRRPGPEGRTAPTPPKKGGLGRPGVPTPQPAQGRSNASPPRRGAWLGLALRGGCPAQRLAAGKRRRRADPSRPRRCVAAAAVGG